MPSAEEQHCIVGDNVEQSEMKDASACLCNVRCKADISSSAGWERVGEQVYLWICYVWENASQLEDEIHVGKVSTGHFGQLKVYIVQLYF